MKPASTKENPVTVAVLAWLALFAVATPVDETPVTGQRSPPQKIVPETFQVLEQ